MDTTKQTIGKAFEGEVVSTAMDKTIVVKVDRFIKHPKYDKYYRKSKKFKAHDPEGSAGKGDKVKIAETTPVSKTVHFLVVNEKNEN